MAEMQPLPEQPIYTGKLTPARWNVVLFALRRYAMPFEVSAPIIAELEQQLSEQQDATRTTEAVQQMFSQEPSHVDEASGLPERSEPVPHPSSGDNGKHGNRVDADL